MNLKLISIVIITTLIFVSCEKGNEIKISKNFSGESHNMGDNCMTCHVSGKEGEGWFTLAGTVYDSASTATNPNGVVKLFSGANGTGNLVATIEVDQNGNFYTTENIDFGQGVFPMVNSLNSSTKHMPNAITTGQCNSCHGATIAKVYVKD